MGTSIKHPVPDPVKPSFVIFDIWALWRSALWPSPCLFTVVALLYFVCCTVTNQNDDMTMLVIRTPLETTGFKIVKVAKSENELAANMTKRLSACVFWLLRLLLVISLCELQFKLLLLSHHVHRTACYARRCRSSWRKTSYIRWLTVRTIRRRLKSRRRERFRCTVYCSLLLKVKSHDWSLHSLFYATFLQIAIFELFVNVFWLTLICLLRACRSLYIGFLLVQFHCIQFVFIHAVYKKLSNEN